MNDVTLWQNILAYHCYTSQYSWTDNIYPRFKNLVSHWFRALAYQKIHEGKTRLAGLGFADAPVKQELRSYFYSIP
jgi:hypothetical protein